MGSPDAAKFAVAKIAKRRAKLIQAYWASAGHSRHHRDIWFDVRARRRFVNNTGGSKRVDIQDRAFGYESVGSNLPHLNRVLHSLNNRVWAKNNSVNVRRRLDLMIAA